MSTIEIGVIVITGMFVLLLTGLPVAFAVGIAGLAGFYLIGGDQGLLMADVLLWSEGANFALMAIPLFTLMGCLLESTGIVEALFRMVASWVGRLPGSLGLSTLLVCGLFSAISGSGAATVATMSTIAFPHLERYKYDRKLVSGILVAGGSLGPVIPPSGFLILYGAMTGQSVARLFMAALLPGILALVIMSLYVVIRAIRDPVIAPKPLGASRKEKLASLRAIIPFLVLLFTVLGSIYLGWATPTEAAALGAVIAFLLAVIVRKISRQSLSKAVKDSVLTGTFILIVSVFAMIFGKFLIYAGVAQWLSETLAAWELSRWSMIILLIALYLFLGMFLDSISILVLTVPLLAPILIGIGFDLTWFGIILVLLIEIGTMTPPFALHVFIFQGITRLPYEDVIKGVWPFVGLWVGTVSVIALFPPLALWLPSVMSTK